MKRYGYSILVVGFLSVGRLIAQTGDAADVVHLTLTDAIALTLENSFQIRISQNNLRIANTNNHIGNAGMLPIVSANASINRSRLNAEQEFLDGRIVPVDNGNRQVVNAGVNMNWRLFDGTRMFATLSRLQQEAIASNLQLKIQIDNTLGQMLQSYYRVAVEQERLALFQSNVMFSEERVRIVDEKYKVGKESKLSLLQAKVDLNSDRSSLVQQRELLVGQKLALVQLMGVDPFDFEVQFQFSI
ncbi:MAG: TolC family protein, partial [Cyclobacteriaceae bacterium]